MPPARILIVEDEIITAQGIGSTLARLDYQVVDIVASGEEAVDRAEALRPDLVLMDVRLAGEMDGIQAAAQIRERSDIAIVYLTAHADEQTLARARLTEPAGYLIKPFSMNVLHSTLEMAIYKHEVEKKLRASEEQYRSLFDRVPVGLFRTTPQGQILDANPAMVRMFGFPDRESLSTVNAADLYEHPEDRRRLQDRLEREGEVRNFEACFRCRDGRPIWVNCNAYAVRDAEGRNLYYEGSLEDIGERKQAEEALHAHSRELELLYEAGQQLSQTLDLDTTYYTLGDIVARIMDCDSLVVSVYDPEEKLIRCAFATHQGQAWDAATFPPLPLNPEGQGTQSMVICSGEALLLGDFQAHAHTSRVAYYVSDEGEFIEHDAAPQDDDLIRSAIIVPMKLAGQVVGVIQVMSYRLNAYSRDHLRILQALASQIAVASNNALLYHQAQEEIARRQEIEETLRNSEERWQFALQGSGDGVWDRNLQNDQVYYSPQWKALLGYEDHEISNHIDEWRARLHPEDRDWVFSQFQQYIHGHIPAFHVEYRFRCKDGSYRWFLARGKIMARSADGRLLRLIGTHSDITARKQAEEALRDSEVRFRTLTQLAPVGVYLTDAQGNCRYVNDRWLDMAGLSFEEALGQGWVQGLHPEDRDSVAENWYRMLESRGRWGLEYRFQTPQGKITWVLGLATAMHDDQGRVSGYVGTNMDITERKLMEQEQEHLYQRLQQHMKQLHETQAQLIQSAKLAAVGELAAGVAHELNNPLTSILGFARLLAWDAAPDDPRCRDLETIAAEAKRAAAIVRNLLTFARQSESYPEPSDLNGIVQETLALVRRHLTDDGLEIVEQYAPDLPFIRVDPGRLKQVFLNLVNNAHQAMSRGGRLTVRSEQVGDELVIHVQDTGRGIPAEQLDRIFEPFFTTKPVGEGTGLGLAVSLGIVRDHGGRIEVQSEEGRGSTFSVWLPLAGMPEA